MESYEVVGTAPETVLQLRDVVRPLVVKRVAKRAASYPDLLTADDREDPGRHGDGAVPQAVGPRRRADHLGAWLKPVVEASIIDELRRRQDRPKWADLPENPDDGIPLEQMLVYLVTPSAQTHYTKLIDDALRARQGVSRRPRAHLSEVRRGARARRDCSTAPGDRRDG